MVQFEDRFKNFYRQFARHFASYDGIIELNLSLGPSGELRFPSYLAGDPRSDFPTRGAFAFYGEAAANSFREFVLEKYGGLEGVNEAWKDILPSPLTNIEEIRVPDPSTLGNPDATTGFFAEGHHVKRYGKDLFDWYHGALIRSGELQLTWAAEVFKETFPGVPLSMKIPGVHWRTAKNSDRAAELAAGLISTGKSTFSTEPEKLGDAYESILSMVKRVTEKTGVEIVTVFTAVEMLDDPEAFNSKSMAESLAGGVIRLARSMGLKIYGENALAQSLSLPWAWDVMLRHFERGMNGVVLLRLQNVAVAAQNGHVKRFVDELVRAVRFVPTCAQSIARSLTSS
jgi:hypothetical protein